MNRNRIGMALFVTVTVFFALFGPNTAKRLLAQSLPPTVTIPNDAAAVKLDANCEEYAHAAILTFNDAFVGSDRRAVVYLKHDADNIYICIQGSPGTFRERFFGVYLDTENRRAQVPEKEDLFLRVRVTDTLMSTLQGTGIPTSPYASFNLRPGLWEAASASNNSGDTAEYRIARDLIASACSTPFGLAVHHQWVREVSDDYGYPSNRAYSSPLQWIQATLANPRCIRVVSDRPAPNTPAASATLYRTQDRAVFNVNNDGYVIHGHELADGATLWATLPVTTTGNATVYYTSGDPIVVRAAAFDPTGYMTITVSAQKPLMVHDLNISAQWYVEGDPARAAWLRESLVNAAHYLYAFTNGQFTLGKVRIQQSYDGWDATNLKLHVNNVFQPRAVIGGSVLTDTVDLSPTVAMTYTPGNIYMGSAWNRFGTPPDQPVTVDGTVVAPATLANDWSLALAHELSHYLLYLFDTYTGVDGKASQALAKVCTGSAMGDVYEPGNQGYIADFAHWDTQCQATEAYHTLQGRTEWATIHLWYPWTIIPSQFVNGPATPPVNLTSVTFIAPSTPPGTLAASQIFTMTYQDGELSSGEARGFILRNDQVYEQGKPAKNATQIALIDAELGDRLCVYDINDHAENSETPRHQFGCEVIKPNDAELVMTKNTAWGPVVKLEQTGPQQLTIALTQPLTAPISTAIKIQLYPENGVAFAPLTLTDNNGVYQGVINLPEVVPPVYAQIWVDETTADPLTRREVMVDRGTGGSGAFGPAKALGGVFVSSSDGNASFESDQPLDLGPGESIAWQSMPGTPPLPLGKSIIGQSYRLDAYPTSLVVSGTIHIQYEDVASLLQAARVGQNSASNVALYFWDGGSWRALDTTLITPVNAADGIKLASAPSQGVGVYAVLLESSAQQIFLPLVQRR
ncbi:MAG: hypothetical protein NT075_01170 [Chloroflexi bacterium]|nr:hypothetical protein [Chloroflexota bacterium]